MDRAAQTLASPIASSCIRDSNFAVHARIPNPGGSAPRGHWFVKPLRIEHWSYDHPANPWLGGGGAYRDWTLLQALSERWDRNYVTADFEGLESKKAAWPGTIWLGGGKSPGLARLNWIRAARDRLKSLEKAGNLPDLFTTSSSILAPIPSLRRHLDRTVLVVHHFVGWNAWRNVGPLAPLCIGYERGLARRGKHFVVVNRKVEARIRALNPEARIARIPNGIDSALLVTKRNPDPEPLVVFMGRLDIQMKGLDRLLDAFVDVRRRIPGVRLEMAGRGSVADVCSLRERIASHPDSNAIQFQQDITEIQKAELLNRAWVFATPSRFEGWCIAAVEAQACHLPVVATTADGFLDSVRDGETGVLVPNDECSVRANLADALVTLLADPDRRTSMGLAAHAWASRHTWDELAVRNEAFLLETLAFPGGR